MSYFLAIVAVGVGTYLFRAVFIVSLAGRPISPRLIRALEHVGPAVLSALIVALMVDGGGAVDAGPPEFAALAAGGFVGWKTRNHIYTVAAGMAVFWLLRIWL